MNPWLNISLEDYEGHMQLPSVQQRALIASDLRGAVAAADQHGSFCYVGCAGGTGLDSVGPETRVCAFDLNPEYVQAAQKRFGHVFRDSRFLVHDINREFPHPETHDLVYVALVLEYLQIDTALPHIAKLVAEGGILALLLQLKSAETDAISQTPYEKIYSLKGLFRHTDPVDLAERLTSLDFKEIRREPVRLESGKRFLSLHFRKGAVAH